MKILTYLLFAATPALAEPPVVEEIQADQASGKWRFSVTLSHPDTGWDHYADGWRIETAEGEVLGTRILHHPHVDEQPFTRSLSAVDIPEGTETVFVRAKCSIDGWSEDSFSFSLK